MHGRVALHAIAAAGLACVFIAGAHAAASAIGSTDATWMANGGSACEKFLTPDVVSAILISPAGPAVKDDANSCHKGAIYISLSSANIAVFQSQMPRIAMTHPMTGVGDAAYWNQAGAVSSVKAPDRGCDINVIGAPNVTKVKDEALGRKLADVCNKLFALK